MRGFLIILLSCFMAAACTKVWYRPDTAFGQARHDNWICKEKTRDLLIKEELPKDESQAYYFKCMMDKGYILRDREEVYVEHHGRAKRSTRY